MSSAASNAALYSIGAAALISALVLLPRAKGAAIGLLWALDIQSNQ
jgi:uncharacterized protein (DUF983 family)